MQYFTHLHTIHLAHNNITELVYLSPTCTDLNVSYNQLQSLNGIQALFILSILISIKSNECDERRFIPFKERKLT